MELWHIGSRISFLHNLVMISTFYLSGVVGKIKQFLGIILLPPGCVKVLGGGLATYCQVLGGGFWAHTETSLFSVHVAVFGPAPLSVALFPLRVLPL